MPSAPASGVPELCTTVAKRDLNLVDSAHALLDEMEAVEDDPDRLDQLYRLDHLITRLRRDNEKILVLTGHDTGDSGTDTVSVPDIVRAALSSIERFREVTIGQLVPLGVAGAAADDVSRALAELLDNATVWSAPRARVEVTAQRTENGGVLITIDDDGAGLSVGRLREFNNRLAGQSVLDEQSSRHPGLALVGRIAYRHGLDVRLRQRQPRGTTAVVTLPAGLIRDMAELVWTVPTRTRPPAHSDGQRSPSRTSPDPADLTESGLPRRVPGRSRLWANGTSARTAPTTESEGDGADPAGQAELLADLSAFSAGEQAAIEEQQASARTETTGEGQP